MCINSDGSFLDVETDVVLFFLCVAVLTSRPAYSVPPLSLSAISSGIAALPSPSTVSLPPTTPTATLLPQRTTVSPRVPRKDSYDFRDGDADKKGITRKCDFPLCQNSSRSRGYCYSHGGGRRCRVEDCPNGAVSRDLCKRHGGGRRCKVDGCKSSSESGGLCYSHGGGKRCSAPQCSARSKKQGLCLSHLKAAAAGDKADVTMACAPENDEPSTPASTPLGDDAAESTVVDTLLSLARDSCADKTHETRDPETEPPCADEEKENVKDETRNGLSLSSILN